MSSKFDTQHALIDNLADKRILVTGASGLIGFNLIKKLVDLGQSGIHLKSLTITGRNFPIWLSGLKSKEIKFLQGDLIRTPEILQNQEFDVIFHCAGSAEPNKFLSDPWSTMKINSTVTMNLIENLAPNGVFVYMSSSEIYTGITRVPYVESMQGISTPDHSRAIYIEAKRSGEAIVNQLSRISNMIGINCRVSLVYGPGFKREDSRVVFTFIRSAVATGKITIHGDGSAIRRYIYVDDAIDQILGSFALNKSNTYNVSGVGQCSIFEIAEIISGFTGAQIVIKANEIMTIGAPASVIVDSSKINELINKSDFITLNQGLQETIQWYRINH